MCSSLSNLLLTHKSAPFSWIHASVSVCACMCVCSCLSACVARPVPRGFVQTLFWQRNFIFILRSIVSAIIWSTFDVLSIDYLFMVHVPGVYIYRRRGKIRWTKLSRFQPHWSFRGNTFVFPYLLLKRVAYIYRKNFRGGLENRSPANLPRLR